MARGKRSPGIALESLTEALQTLPAREALGRADRRSVGRARSLVAQLEKDHRPSDVARVLVISTQKYVWTRRYIEQGRAGSPVLNDLLTQATQRVKIADDRPRDHREDYQYENRRGKISKKKIDVTEVGEDFVKAKGKWMRDIKPGGFASKQSAVNWLGNVTGGKEYFWLVRKKNGRWHIYDNRTAKERAAKKVRGKSRAQDLKEKYSPDLKQTRHGKAKSKVKAKAKPKPGGRASAGRRGRAKARR